MKQKQTYQENRFTLYTLLWERCAKAMQNKIASGLDYTSLVYNNPIELLREIKKHLVNYQDTRYEIEIITDAFQSTFTSRKRMTKVYNTTQDNLRRQQRYWNLICGDR